MTDNTKYELTVKPYIGYKNHFGIKWEWTVEKIVPVESDGWYFPNYPYTGLARNAQKAETKGRLLIDILKKKEAKANSRQEWIAENTKTWIIE
jgi:hypothetical protein